VPGCYNSSVSARQYFLGIGGDQTGPYAEEDLLGRIRQGQVPPDSLVWFEGLPDWQPIQSVEFLKDVFSEAGADFTATNIEPKPLPPSSGAKAGFRPLTDAMPAYSGPSRSALPASNELDASSFASGSSMTTVFSEKEATFGAGGGGDKKKTIALLAVLAVAVVGGVVYMTMEGGPSLEVPPPTASAPIERLPAQDDRTTRLRKAMSELFLKPDEILPILREIVKENANDGPGKEAIEALVDFYKNQRNPSEAGRILLQAGRPLEASQLFLSDPPSYREAEEAIFAAYKVSTNTNKRDLLIQDIRLLLGQVNNVPLAIERIRVLEKEFKGTKHPFGYYLTSVDSRIADIFNRTSFFFVQRLLAFIETEFPHMSLAKRPIVEILKDKRGKYRIAGRYEGDISLHQDRMENMKIVFWLKDESWVVVETNLTPERAKWAGEERERIKDDTLTADEMLLYMEGVFRQQFPKTAIHESVSQARQPAKK
jgi:hypothetical protein